MAKQAAEIIAFHLWADIETVKDGRYQRHASPAVYVVVDNYYCAPTANQKPPKGFDWALSGEEYGRSIYKSTPQTTLA